MVSTMTQNKTAYMELALYEARGAAMRGEVPVGAVLVSPQGEILAQTGNRTIELNDPTAHAEILAIRQACSEIGSQRLAGCDLYVTLEPCPMCASAISNARISRLYYGAEDVKSGGVDNGPRIYSQKTCHHSPDVYGGISEQEAAEMLQSFFASKRD